MRKLVKRVLKKRKPKIFNAVNLVLIGFLLIEVALILDYNFTGMIISKTATSEVGVSGIHQGEEIEVTGKLEIITWDDFENQKSGEIYYLNKDGKKYELELKNPQPILYKSEVSVKGILNKNKIVVDSIESVKVSGQGATGEEIDPWPKTLGEQKYAVVYLVEENQTNFSVESYTNQTFFLVNNFIVNTSYGKAWINIGFAKSFVYNLTGCFPDMIRNYAISQIDPFIDFTQYDGIIIYHPYISDSCYAGSATLGKDFFTSLDGGVYLYNIWVNGFFSESSDVLNHEIGHNFGLGHAALIYCGDFPNIKHLDLFCDYNNYGDCFDTMGCGSSNPFNIIGKLEVLGWVDESNFIEENEGVFFISPSENNLEDTSKIYGIKIPLLWNTSTVNVINSFGSQLPLDYFNPFTHYYIEYRKKFSEDYLNGFKFWDNETTYNLNLSNIKSGVFLRLGANYFTYADTLLLHQHPNTFICSSTPTHTSCGHTIYPFPYLLENETYYDSFNNMSISVLDMNESGALVEIKKWYGKLNCSLGQIIGDVDNDGQISIGDAANLISLVNGEYYSAPDNICCVDMNKDKIVNQTDAEILANIVGGVATSPGKCGDCGKTPSGKCSGLYSCYNSTFKYDCYKCCVGGTCQKTSTGVKCVVNKGTSTTTTTTTTGGVG